MCHLHVSPQAQALSNTAWALATLGFVPPGGLLEKLAARAANIIGTFRPQATSNTLCAPLAALQPVTNLTMARWFTDGRLDIQCLQTIFCEAAHAAVKACQPQCCRSCIPFVC